MMRIGVLALQGAFIEHERMLRMLDADAFEIRKKQELCEPMDAIILPGGESTVMGKLLCELDMMQTIRERIRDGLPVLGTCAGLILLAEKIADDTAVHIGTMRITAKRNAYGRQLGSFAATAEWQGTKKIPMTFIRAPYIQSVGDGVRILAEVNHKIVAAQQDNQLVTAFHPELTDNVAVHRYFLEHIVAASRR